MSAFVTLSSDRICLRHWRDGDREAFAAMNSDARVMEFFLRRLSRVESDAMVDRIQQDFSERGFGLWAIEVPDVAPFIGFAGLAVPGFSAHFTPCVEVGWRLASSIGDTVMQRRRPDWRSATGLGLSRSQKSYLSHLRRTAAREQSWNGLGCAAILLRISTILSCRKVINSEGMYFTGSVRVHRAWVWLEKRPPCHSRLAWYEARKRSILSVRWGPARVQPFSCAAPPRSRRCRFSSFPSSHRKRALLHRRQPQARRSAPAA
jgi:hypothetical protein